MNNSTRVIINTSFLYANMLVNLIVQLWAVQLILQALGAIDYGIYNLIASIVSLFAFMNVAMSAATIRFMSFEIGNNNSERLKETFYNSIILHLIIGVFVAITLEVGGDYYIKNLLNAPTERLHAANILLHFIVFSTIVNIIMVPYEATINAHENMGTIASINIFDSILKLAIALYLGYSTSDRLLTYGLLTMLCATTTFALKFSYCVRHYPESAFSFHRIKDLKLLKQIASFAGWNFIGTSCSMARYQGTAMIINAFFGILMNTAYGIAQQVNGLLLFFANTIIRAIRPQIIKSEGDGNRDRMLRLSMTTCKITSIMVALLGIPLFVEMEMILNLWLKQVPSPYCIMFCRAFIVIVFINQLTIGLQIAIESVGKIKLLQTVVGSMHIISLPIGYLFFRAGYDADYIMICIIIEELICIILRTWIAKKQTSLNHKIFIWNNVLPCIALVVGTYIAVRWLHESLQPRLWLSLISVTMSSTIILSTMTYCYILNKEERSVINNFIKALTQKLHIR